MEAVSRAIEAVSFAPQGLKVCVEEPKSEGTPPVATDEAGPYGRLYSPVLDDRGRAVR